MHNFTQEDLLQFLYNETSIEKTAAIKEALVNDWNLREKFNFLSKYTIFPKVLLKIRASTYRNKRITTISLIHRISG